MVIGCAGWEGREGQSGFPELSSTIPYNMVLQYILGLGYLEKEQVERVGRL